MCHHKCALGVHAQKCNFTESITQTRRALRATMWKTTPRFWPSSRHAPHRHQHSWRTSSAHLWCLAWPAAAGLKALGGAKWPAMSKQGVRAIWMARLRVCAGIWWPSGLIWPTWESGGVAELMHFRRFSMWRASLVSGAWCEAAGLSPGRPWKNLCHQPAWPWRWRRTSSRQTVNKLPAPIAMASKWALHLGMHASLNEL